MEFKRTKKCSVTLSRPSPSPCHVLFEWLLKDRKKVKWTMENYSKLNKAKTSFASFFCTFIKTQFKPNFWLLGLKQNFFSQYVYIRFLRWGLFNKNTFFSFAFFSPNAFLKTNFLTSLRFWNAHKMAIQMTALVYFSGPEIYSANFGNFSKKSSSIRCKK